MKRSMLVIIVAWLFIACSPLLLFLSWARFADDSSAPAAAAPAFQGLIMLTTGIAILRQDGKAAGLVWTNTVLSALGVLARGLVPLDLFFWFLLLAFAIWFSKKSKDADRAVVASNIGEISS